MWEERILIDYSPHLWGWPHYCPSPHPPIAFSNLLSFVLPSKHTLADTTEKPSLTAVALPHECAHMWTAGLKGQDVEHIFNLTCIPSRSVSAACGCKPEKTRYFRKDKKVHSLCYLSKVSSIRWVKSVRVVSLTLGSVLRPADTVVSINGSYWGWGKVQVLSTTSVLFMSSVLHLLSCLFPVISGVWDASVKA